jgi:hypothetical protein
MIRLKNVTMIALYSAAIWTGYKGYRYLFDYKTPTIAIQGLEDRMWVSGSIQCSVATDKSGYLTICIDDNPIFANIYIPKDTKYHELIIPIDTLANGEHHCKLSCVDTTYNRNSICKDITFHVDNSPLHATFMGDAQIKVLQGRTLKVQFQTNKEIAQAKVHALAELYDCFSVAKNQHLYECYIPISCEEKPNEYMFCVDVCDRVGNKISLDNKFEIVACDFKKQVIQIDPLKIQEEKSKGKTELEFEEHVMQLVNSSPHEKLWKGTFLAPVQIDKITCEYGTIRTSQERGRYMHKALDVITKPKSVIWAPQNGIVVVKDRYDFSGNTVVVDHGHGIFSLFYHLDDFADIEVGQKVAQGKPLGTLGKTGYATGYHLHWEMRVNNVPVDPMQWVNEAF